MPFKKVTAIIRTNTLEAVESGLACLGVPGVTVTRVKGFGEYANFMTRDWLSAHARLEVFVDAAQVDAVVEVVTRAAHTGLAGDGIVVVLPVDQVHRIRDRCRLRSFAKGNE
jgi:nitrogen regulatory protein P-II 1